MGEPNAGVPVWSPTVDMRTARPVVFALADYPGGNDVRNYDAVTTFVRLSERPPTQRLLQIVADTVAANPSYGQGSLIEQLLNRPWNWLALVMWRAGSDGDHHLVLAGLWWACYWTSELLPRNNSIGALEEWGLCPIRPSLKTEILSLGIASASRLPENFVVAGDQTGQLLVGRLAQIAPEILRR